MYNNDPTYIGPAANLTAEEKARVLGGEVAMWSEEVDQYNLDQKVWPRASAAAERWWSSTGASDLDLPSGKIKQTEMFFAYRRFLVHHQRLVKRGLAPERTQPEWCRLSPKGFCWYPCVCNTTNSEWYGGANAFGFAVCGWCKERDSAPTPAPPTTTVPTAMPTASVAKTTTVTQDFPPLPGDFFSTGESGSAAAAEEYVTKNWAPTNLWPMPANVSHGAASSSPLAASILTACPCSFRVCQARATNLDTREASFVDALVQRYAPLFFSATTNATNASSAATSAADCERVWTFAESDAALAATPAVCANVSVAATLTFKLEGSGGDSTAAAQYPDLVDLQLGTDDSYDLEVGAAGKHQQATLTAKTVFGLLRCVRGRAQARSTHPPPQCCPCPRHCMRLLHSSAVRSCTLANTANFRCCVCRRGFETFSQLLAKPAEALQDRRNFAGLVVETAPSHWDGHAAYAGCYQVYNLPWSIQDAARYQWRGLMLDVSRDFFPLAAIERTIDGMAYAKLNTLHLHITDSQNFPLEITGEFADLTHGYSEAKVYSRADIKALVRYANLRGVRLVPEIDTPAHSTAWAGKDGKWLGMVACANAEPWTDYCFQPPCGQLDPLNETAYRAVEAVLGQVALLFPDNYLHIGADEPFASCWNHSATIRAWWHENGFCDEPACTNASHVTAGYANLSDAFSNRRETLVQRLGKTVIGWDELHEHSPALGKKTAMQVWHDHTVVGTVLGGGYDAVVSNYADSYLDCGFGHWIVGAKDAGGGKVVERPITCEPDPSRNFALSPPTSPVQSWCDPYKTWETM
jgi:hypothetical protein